MPAHLDHLGRLVEHLAWADQRVLDSLRHARNASPPAFSLYSHVLGAEHTWIARIRGEAAEVSVWPDLSLDECEVLSTRNVTALRELVGGITEADRRRLITYRNSAGVEFTTGLEDILLHVSLHGGYHRGQVAALLRSAGDEPSPTDYIQWVRASPLPASQER